MLPNFYKDVAPLLINRFKEREENVKADIFHVFNALLRQTKLAVPKALMTGSGSISTTDSPELLILRQLSSQIPALVKAVNRQLRFVFTEIDGVGEEFDLPLASIYCDYILYDYIL